MFSEARARSSSHVTVFKICRSFKLFAFVPRLQTRMVEVLIVIFVASRLPKYLIQRLQLVQNYAVRLVESGINMIISLQYSTGDPSGGGSGLSL